MADSVRVSAILWAKNAKTVRKWVTFKLFEAFTTASSYMLWRSLQLIKVSIGTQRERQSKAKGRKNLKENEIQNLGSNQRAFAGRGIAED